ncbi:MAG: RNA-binding protein [Planctomycetia bacterium]
MNESPNWAEVKKSFPVGSKVNCMVTKHMPFGVFVRIMGIPYDGLIQITDFKDTGRMTVEEFPVIGTNLVAVVLGFKEFECQVWLGVKPSRISI